MEMVQQRKQGVNSQEPSTSRGFTWADLGTVHNESHSRVSTNARTVHSWLSMCHLQINVSA